MPGKLWLIRHQWLHSVNGRRRQICSCGRLSTCDGQCLTWPVVHGSVRVFTSHNRAAVISSLFLYNNNKILKKIVCNNILYVSAWEYFWNHCNTRTLAYTYPRAHTTTDARTHMHTHIRERSRACEHKHIHITRTPTHMCMHIRARTHAHTRTHTRMHAHTDMRKSIGIKKCSVRRRLAVQ